ncbi:MAG: hypothetical protein ACJAY7_001847 [Pseudohongiellaceae bacterium]|jgi:hypothetical protein
MDKLVFQVPAEVKMLIFKRFVRPLMYIVVLLSYVWPLFIFSPILAAEQLDPLFSGSEIIDLRLEAPFSLIDSERDKEKRYDGKLSYMDAQGERIIIDANFEVRGNWRLVKENCRHPQLWVDLKKNQTEGTLFENQNRLKLVVQCDRYDKYRDFLLKEQLAYELFAMFSDYNFSTRLFKVGYVEAGDADAGRTNLGFFIEHKSRLAKRLQFEKVKENSIFPTELNSLQSSLVSVFSFLIGSTDYSTIQGPVGDDCCHNLELLKAGRRGLFAFPYDFDNTGFVDASYAAGPSPNIGTRSLKKRVYRGFCVHNDTLDQALSIARDSQGAVEAAIANHPLLRDGTKKESLRFISEFYEILENPKKVKKRLHDSCRNWND